MSLSLQVRAIAVLFFCVVFALPAAAVDRTYVVDAATDEPDDTYDGICETALGDCTLRAAIMEANDEVPATLHSITFSVAKVTLAADLPAIIQPTVIDGGDGATRVEIDGGGSHGCFSANSPESLAPGTSNPLIPEANNSRFENLVIYGCDGAAITLSGHGFAVYNNYIGTDVTGNAAAGTPNSGSGIIFSAAFEDGDIPNNPLPLPDELTDIASIVLFLAGAAPNLPPTGIIENVVSGNALHGIEIHGQYASTAIVFDNKIGVGEDGITQIANGTAGSAPEHGVYVYASAYLNFIGVNNVIAGNDLDDESAGVFLDTGKVPFPNFVAGNDIGASKNNAYALDLGNGGLGIHVGDVRPTTSSDPIENPTGLGAVIGPGNIVGYNGTGGCTPIQDSCVEGGIAVTNSTSDGVRIWGNLVGINDPSSIVDIGNHGDGINVVGTNIEIGGSTLVEGNLIGSNDRHGLVIRGGTGTNRVTAHANYIGVTPLDSAVANTGHGIWLLASGTQIGGAAYANERNVIANNGGHAIRFDNGGNAFGNLIQQNEIYNVAPGFLAIDLDNPAGTADATDNNTVVDRSGSAINSYTNWQQNTVTLTSTSGAGTAWELRSALNKNYRIDFYSAPDEGDAKTWLCEVAATTSTPDGDGGGMASGTAGCAAGGPGLFVTATATDISPTDGVGETDRPGFPVDDPVMNTSEFAAAVQAADQVTFSSATYVGTENGGSIVVTLQRVGTGNAGGISVDVADLLTGSASAGGVDYTFVSPETVSWAGVDATDKTVTITLVNDALLEPSETIDLQLQNPNGAELGTITSAMVTIDDDGDTPPSLAINDAANTEGPGAQITFTVTKTGATGLTATVDYSVIANTATVADYTDVSGMLTFGPGVMTQNIVVDITDDTIFEGQEQFTVVLSNPTNASISDANGIGSINDNDTPTITINDVSLAERNAGTTAFTFTVTLSNETASNISVNWATADDGAIAPGDYASDSGTVTFIAGAALTQDIVVNVVGDTTAESDETFFVNLSGETAGSITDPQGVGTIQNDEAAPTFTVDDITQVEGNAGTSNFIFTVTLTPVSGAQTTVDVATGVGTATAGVDYVANAQTLTFPPGTPTQTFTVVVNGDTTFEGDETFPVALSNATGGAVTSGSGLGTITNDDAMPSISIADVSQVEGNAGTSNFTFNVSLSNPSDQAVSVDFTTADGTAGATDYVTNAGTVNFAPGVTLQTIDVVVNGDTMFETNETFTVTLASPSGGVIGTGSATGTITNDDSQPTISIDNVSQLEGNAGTSNFTFTVTLSNPSYLPISVDFATANGTADGADYVANSGTVNFASGVTMQTIDVVVNGDLTDEADDTFFVNLTNPANATIAAPQGTGTIQNDDSPTPTFTVDNVTLNEGNAGTTAFTFTVTLAPVSGVQTSVDVATADVTAIAGTDYAANMQTLTFPAGTASQTFTVLVTGETTFETNETFSVSLSNPTGGAQVSGSGLGTINNDDLQPAISIDNVSQLEGNAGTSNFTFTVTLSNPSSQAISVDFATADGSADVADYVPNSGSVNFASGVTTQTIDIMVNGDLVDEADETFFVDLTNPINATIGIPQGTGTIQNDDSPTPTFTINSVTQAEGDAGTTSFDFTVTLAPLSGVETTVDVATSDLTAIAGVDYTASAQTLTFPAGTATQTFSVLVNGDTTFEPNETFTVTLSNPTGGAATSGSGLGTITNDDSQPSISIADVSQLEGDAGFANMTFVVSLSNPSSQSITVDWLTVDGTASTLTADYADDAGTLTFAPGELTKNAIVVIVGDTDVEANETFTVDLSNATNATIADASGTGTILDDDATPSLAIDDPTATEGDPTITFTVTRSGDTSGASSVDYAVNAGSATTPEDYTASAINLRTPAVQSDGSRPGGIAAQSALSGTLSFAAGELTKSITLDIVDDTTFEGSETFTVTLSNPVGATITDGSATATLADDDPEPTISIADVSANEGDAGITTFTFTVTLSNPSALSITVDYATADGTATVAGLDYMASNGTLTFAPGVVAQTISVSVDGDTTEEPDETFAVNLSNPVNATIVDGAATGTIVDDDAVAVVAGVPTLGARELMLLASLLAAVALLVMRKV